MTIEYGDPAIHERCHQKRTHAIEVLIEIYQTSTDERIKDLAYAAIQWRPAEGAEDLQPHGGD